MNEIRTVTSSTINAQAAVPPSPVSSPASGNFTAQLPQSSAAAGGALNQSAPVGLLQAVSNLSTDLQSLLTYLQSASSVTPGTQQAGTNTESSVFGAAPFGSSASGKPGKPTSGSSASSKPPSDQTATLSPIDQAGADIEAALASLQAAADRQTAAVDAFSVRIDAIGNSLSNAQATTSPNGLEANITLGSNSSDASTATASPIQNGNGSTTSSEEDRLNSFVQLVARDLATAIRSYSSNGRTSGLGVETTT